MIRHNPRHERGQVVVVFALLLPIFLGLGAIVIGIGNWYTHAKHLQTKADAAVFAGGTAWGFPCAADVDAAIEQQARTYLGPHIKADTTPFVGTSYNPQVGGVGQSQIHGVLNGSAFYDDDSNPLPSERNDPLNASICHAKILDVKATEDNSFPLFSLLPLFPDIKRKARIQIEQGSDFGGLLPIAVRVPKPTSAAAIFYDESSVSGTILDTRYLREVCTPAVPSPCLGNIPAGLGQWTTSGASLGNSRFQMPAGQVGVVIALSFRPPCPGTQCFNISTGTYPTVDALCNQGSGVGVSQCFYATGGSTQTVESGLQFIRGYANGSVGAGTAPWVRGVWLTTATGTNCSNGGYFSAPASNNCFAMLNADVVDNATAGNVEVRYKLVAGNTSGTDDDPPNACNNNYSVNCDLTSAPAAVELDTQYARHAFVIRVRLQNTVVTGVPACNDSGFDANCQWFFTANVRTTTPPTNAQIFASPVQRGFMGNIDRSAAVKFLQLWGDPGCDGTFEFGLGETGPAASVLASSPGTDRCFMLEMGLQGGLAKDQDEVPIQLNIGATSQSSVLDCDPDISNLKDEIVQGCGPDGDPIYKAHDFLNTPFCPKWTGINNFFSLPKPAPWDNWPPFRCVATQTSNQPQQVIDGLNERFFGDPTKPSCPVDDASFVKGRNYWHDENNQFLYDPDGAGPALAEYDYFTFAQDSRNHGNLLRKDDPRYVLLFMTPYNSFTGNGNEIYPITLIGAFYITGYGITNGAGNFTNEDPCSDGNGAAVGAGNDPPPDLLTTNQSAVAWGHFVQPVDLGISSGGTGILCQTAGDTTPCVAVLVE